MSERRTRADVEAVVGQIRRYVPPMAPYFEIDAPLGEYAAACTRPGPTPRTPSGTSCWPAPSARSCARRSVRRRGSASRRRT